MIRIFWICIFLLPQISFGADYIKVLKVKGRKAIVKLPLGSDYKKGDQIRIDSGIWQERGLDGNGKRRYSIAGTIAFGQTNNSNKTSGVTTKTDEGLVEATFKGGYNKRTYEFGPEISYLVQKENDEQNTTVSMGGYYQYNFKDNKPGQVFVPYAGLAFRLLSKDSESVKRDGIGAGVNLGILWFPVNDHVCAIGQFSFDYSSLNSENVESTATGYSTRIGVGSYF